MLDTIVIADTSCLIALAKIDALHLLRTLYSEVFITKEVVDEFGEVLPEWIQVQKVTNLNYQNILSIFLDPGEASAIALAFQYNDVTLILDDLKARKEAKRLGFKISGTLGVLSKAKSLNQIKEIKPFIDSLISSGFRISPSIVNDILRSNNEA
jgi:predicted nucleic acid-binding protein